MRLLELRLEGTIAWDGGGSAGCAGIQYPCTRARVSLQSLSIQIGVPEDLGLPQVLERRECESPGESELATGSVGQGSQVGQFSERLYPSLSQWYLAEQKKPAGYVVR